jgi:hydroxyethylthiazole kinase-like uncharacterized protein yjeF
MRVVTPDEMNLIDKIAINDFGIPSIVLMENAALSVVKEVEKTLGSLSWRNILIFAGKGNNGGDAFAVARHLFNRKSKVIVYTLADKDTVKGDAAINLAILGKMGVEIIDLSGLNGVLSGKNMEANAYKELERQLTLADLVIDGIFGTGLKGDVGGTAYRIINMINTFSRNVISIDIPSGLNSKTGEVSNICVKACKTITFALPKVGAILFPGCEYTGELIVADIGIPIKAIDNACIKKNIVDKDFVSKGILKRCNQTNKGDYGKVLIISGSKGMTGAGCLSARSAFKAGAGLVYLAVPGSLNAIYSSALIEAITIPLEDQGKGYILNDNIGTIEKQISGKNVIAVGPGLSLNDSTIEVVHWLIKHSNIPLVIDADALNAVARDIEILKDLKTTAVVTPHPGEMARLTGKTPEQIQKDRINVAREFALKWKVITVLKGWRTVIALPDGTIYINTTGNPGMATAGTGDVLTGLIASFMGQGIQPELAALLGVYIHGSAGDRASSKYGEYGAMAGDLVEEIPFAIKDLKIG